jgi:CheY-like chemotaxis protein
MFRAKFLISPFPSTLKLTGRMVGRSKWNKLVAVTPDWRDLFNLAALELGSDELSLMAELARITKLPFIGSIKDLDIAKPGENELALGSVAIRQADRMIGLAAIEPARLGYFESKITRDQIFLTSWGLLKEKVALQTREDHDLREQQSILILNSLIGQAEEQESFKIEVSWQGERLEYHIQLKDGRIATGEILPEVARGFVNFLESQTLQDSFLVANTPIVVCRILNGFQLDIGKAVSSEREVWVVEDDSSFKRAIETYLVGRNIRVRAFKSAEIAIRELKQTSLMPRVIVTDEHLYRMRGSEFVAAMRKETVFHAIDFIGFTSDFTVETRLGFLNAGAIACIDKGDDLKILIAHLERSLNKLELLRAK